MCSRPAVSTITASKPSVVASATAPLARATGSISPAGSCTRTPAFCRDDVQLLDGRRPLDVGRHEQRMASLLRQPLRELARGRRLAGALQPEQQDDARPLGRRLQAAFGIAEQRHHLVADDLDDLLRRRQATAQHILLRPRPSPGRAPGR